MTDKEHQFTDADAEKRDKLLLKLLRTPPDAKRPKRERKKPESLAEKDA